jgi:hypothetical protein
MMDQQAPNGADFMVQPGGGQVDAVQNGISIAANSGGSGTPVNGTGGGSTPGSTGIKIFDTFVISFGNTLLLSYIRQNCWFINIIIGTFVHSWWCNTE